MKQRRKRGTYLGGHDVAALVGMHPYSSIGQVYAKCALGEIGITDVELDADPSKPSVLRRGKICESGVIDYIERVCLGMAPGTMARDVWVEDDDVPFFGGTIDACELDDNDLITHIHEITVTSSRVVDDHWGPDGDPGGAAKYKWLQNQWYQGLSGAGGGTIWLFVADTGEIRRYPVARKEAAIEEMRNDAEEFWLRYVLPRRPPPVECEGLGAWAVAEPSLDAMYGLEDKGPMDPTPELVDAANLYAQSRQDVKDAEERKRGAAAMLKNALGDHTNSKWNGGRVSWKRNKDVKKLDKDAVIDELVGNAGMSDEDKAALFESHSTPKQGPRILRVTISAAEKDKE
jgi:hypothetical protein